MQIFVDHLTRMRDDFICVAGLAADGRHIRPVLGTGRWQRQDTRAEGGPVSIGALVELGPARPVGSPPEVEDHEVERRNVRLTSELSDDEFWNLLEVNTHDALTPCFGQEMTATATRKATVPIGQGAASLGLLRVSDTDMAIDRSAVRIECTDPHLGPLRLKVTDARLYDVVGGVRSEMARTCARRIAQGWPCILAVGLSRPFQPPGDPSPPRHWLQVNNLHFPDYFDAHPIFRR